MRYPKLSIFKSTSGTHSHYVYRFKNQNENIDYPIEYYINNLKPIAIIDESKVESIEKDVLNHLMARENHPKNNENFIAFSTSFDFTYSNSVIKVNLKNDLLSKASSYINIYLGKNVISKLEFFEDNKMTNVIIEPDRINNYIKILNSNSILILHRFVNYDIITFDMKVKVINFIDESAHGVYEANLSNIETNKYFSFYQDTKTKKNTYYYRIITKSKSDAISNLSRPVVCEVSENADSISTILESSDDFRDNGNPTWKHADTKPNSIDIKVLKENNNMASEIIEVIGAWDINSDDSLIASDGIRKIKITNIWHKENRKKMFRDKKVFRAKNRKGDITTSYSSPIIIEGRLEILIDKMVILKKNVTTLPVVDRNKPILLNDSIARTLKIYVRQGGRYFKDFFVNDFESNENDFKDKPVSSVTLDSRFPLLDIKDSCVYSNTYNYTVYLYDEIGKISEPIVVVM